MTDKPNTVPTMIPVHSSNVHAVSYVQSTKKFYVQYGKNELSLYRYDNVSPNMVKDFWKDDSKGAFLNKKIKGKKTYSKWSGSGWIKEKALQKKTVQNRNKKKKERARARK